MITFLPFELQILILAVLGAFTGSVINYGIYAWPYFLKRKISPWQSPHPDAPPRIWSDPIPIIGWFGLRREAVLYGKWFWIRPLIIELVWLVGLPFFFFWQKDSGLLGEAIYPPPDSWAQVMEVWFWLHTVLFALMFIATFIDFDERTIPDAITIPGTLFALTMAAIFPFSRLPESISTMAGMTFHPLSFANGSELPLLGVAPKWMLAGVDWHFQSIGLAIVMIVFWGWILALMPKICTLRFGFWRGIKIMVASCLRPRRKTECVIRIRQRTPRCETRLLFLLGIIGSVALIGAKGWLPRDHWDSLFCSFFGLGFGGIMIWSVRIVGQYALGREAMGFGDVTLMAMIGAFLGWQAALLTLPAAAIFALAFVVVSYAFTRDSQLAFGPFLCMGAAVVIFFWGSLWPSMTHYFSLGEWLFVILAVMLILMWGMLIGLSLLRGNEPTD